jgi:hypothetical protein
VGADRGRSRRPAASDNPAALEGLLDDVRALRLTLTADLHAAAAAAEEGAAQIASDILEADRDELARFRRVAEMRMSGASQPEPVAAGSPSRWRRRAVVALPAVPLIGAMAVSAAAVTGALPMPGQTAGSKAATQAPAAQQAASPVTSSFEELVSVVGSHRASAHDVIAAARRLHRQIAELIATTSHDPARAEQVAELLRMEQSLLLQAQPPGASVVLDATRRLAEQLVSNAPRLPDPAPTDTKLPRPLPTSSHKGGGKPAASPAPRKTTSPKPSQPAPSASPDPSSSPGTGHIPVVP